MCHKFYADQFLTKDCHENLNLKRYDCKCNRSFLFFTVNRLINPTGESMKNKMITL